MTFDMHRSRAVAEKCQSHDDSIDHDYWNARAGMVLPTALNEIDRLQLRDAAMQAQIVANAKRIAELEAGMKSGFTGYQYRIIEKQRAALKKLGQAKRARGKALVEERKLRMQLDASRFGMGIPEEIAIARAREQLRQEGKL